VLRAAGGAPMMMAALGEPNDDPAVRILSAWIAPPAVPPPPPPAWQRPRPPPSLAQLPPGGRLATLSLELPEAWAAGRPEAADAEPARRVEGAARGLFASRLPRGDVSDIMESFFERRPWVLYFVRQGRIASSPIPPDYYERRKRQRREDRLEDRRQRASPFAPNYWNGFCDWWE